MSHEGKNVIIGLLVIASIAACFFVHYWNGQYKQLEAEFTRYQHSEQFERTLERNSLSVEQKSELRQAYNKSLNDSL